MNTPDIDAARLTLALTELRLPAIKALWPQGSRMKFLG